MNRCFIRMKDIFPKKLFFHQSNKWLEIIPVYVLNPVVHGLLVRLSLIICHSFSRSCNGNTNWNLLSMVAVITDGVTGELGTSGLDVGAFTKSTYSSLQGCSVDIAFNFNCNTTNMNGNCARIGRC